MKEKPRGNQKKEGEKKRSIASCPPPTRAAAAAARIHKSTTQRNNSVGPVHDVRGVVGPVADEKVAVVRVPEVMEHLLGLLLGHQGAVLLVGRVPVLLGKAKHRVQVLVNEALDKILEEPALALDDEPLRELGDDGDEGPQLEHHGADPHVQLGVAQPRQGLALEEELLQHLQGLQQLGLGPLVLPVGVPEEAELVHTRHNYLPLPPEMPPWLRWLEGRSFFFPSNEGFCISSFHTPTPVTKLLRAPRCP